MTLYFNPKSNVIFFWSTENSNYSASSNKIICSLLYRCVFLFAEFVIQVKEENGDRHKLHVSVHQSVSHNYSVGGLRPGKNYEITVTAKNRFGESAPSERIKVITDQTGKRLISFSFLYIVWLTQESKSGRACWTQGPCPWVRNQRGRDRVRFFKVFLVRERSFGSRKSSLKASLL